MILYNLRTLPESYTITKFDDDMNVESSYVVSDQGCTCPQGHKPTCRHRKMLAAMLPIVDSEEFYCFDNAMYYGMEGGGYKTPKTQRDSETHILYKTGDADAPDIIKDRNGEVVLGLCRVCGRAEITLYEPCTPQAGATARDGVLQPVAPVAPITPAPTEPIDELPRIKRRI